MTEFAYKVVQVIDGKRKSAVVWNTELSRIYTPNLWTTAKVGGILCFEHEIYAKDFIRNNYLINDIELWKVVVKSKVRLGRCKYTYPSSFNIENVKSAWEGLDYIFNDWPIGTDDWPIGTVAFKSVRLIEKIPF